MRSPFGAPALLVIPLLALVATLSAASSAWSAPPLRTWSLGGSGLWNTAGNWTPTGAPLGGDSVFVPLSLGTHTITLDLDTPGLHSLVQASPAATLDLNGHALTFSYTGTSAGTLLASGASQSVNGVMHTLAGSQVQVANGAVLHTNSTWQNDGHAVVHSSAGASPSEFRVNYYQSLGGTGDLQLADPVNALITSPSSYTLTHEAGHLIHGAGRITLPFVNHGTVTADYAPGSTLAIEYGSTINDGTLRAANGARLLLNGNVTNTGGLLLADGGNVELNGGTVSNGLFHATGTSAIETNTNTAIAGEINLTGTMNVNSGHALSYGGGTLADSGTIVVHPSGASPSVFRLTGYLTLGGPGSLLLNDQALASIDSPSSYTLTHSAGHTVHGAGSITLPLTNHGLVSADLAGRTLTLANNVANDGTLQAVGGGTLALQGFTVANTGAVAASGGDVLLTNQTINGGAVYSAGGNIVNATAGTVSLNNITTSGTIQVSSGAVLTTQGTIANSGNVLVRPPSGSGTATLRLNGYATYQGGGSIQLTHATQSVFDSPSSYAVTQNAGHTLHGTGTVTLPVVNHGLVSADVGGQPLTMTNSVINDGTLQATAAGTLALTGAGITNLGGTIRANGGDVVLTNGTINGGTLARTGTSVVAIAGNCAMSTLANSGVVRLGGGATLSTTGTITNTGNFMIHQPASLGVSTLRLPNYVTFTGAGAIQLTDAALSLIDSPAGYTLTNAADHLVHGTGVTALPITNHGLVSADVAGQPLTMSSTLVNDGTMQAVSGGLLRITSANLNNSSGTLAATTGDVRIANSAFAGGTLTSGAGHTIAFDGNSALAGNFTNKAQTVVNGGVLLALSSLTLTDSATIQVRSAGDTAAAVLRLNNYAALAGNGALVMTHGTQSIIDSPIGYSLTNLAPHTIRGTGQIASGLYNQGLVVADVADSVLAVTSSLLALTGTQAAANGGTLAFSTNTPNYASFTLTGGTWMAGANSKIRFPGVDIRNLAASVVLDGAGSDLVSADSSLTALRRIASVRVGGGLTLRNGRVLSTPAGLSSSGIVAVGPNSVLTVGSAAPIAYQMDTSATYVVEIAGRTAGSWGRIAVNGTASVAGHLRIRILNGFVPVLGDTFEVMTFSGEHQGEFATVDSQLVAPHVVMNHVWKGNRLLLVTRYASDVTDVPTTPDVTPPPSALAFSARGGAGVPARLELSLPHAAAVDVSLYDVSGRRVASLARDTFAAGRWSWTWNAAHDQAASGVYFARAVVTMDGVNRVLNSRVVLWR